MRLRNPALLLFLAAALRADSALDVHTLFETAAEALGNGQAAAFLAVFDPSTPGFTRLRSDTGALVRMGDAMSNIEWRKNEGDDQQRSVSLNWLLDITERNGAGALTHRRAQVDCRLAKKGGQWRIVSFAPLDFFAPPQADQAWLVVAGAAEGLGEAAADSTVGSGDLPAANARKFMEAFDAAMPGAAQLRDNVLALEQRSAIESSVDLVSNEGDDAERTIVVDWTMNLVAHETGIASVTRTQTVTLRVLKKGKAWRITSLEPRSFFLPPGAGQTPGY